MALSADRTLDIRGLGTRNQIPAAVDTFYVGAIIVVDQNTGAATGGEAATDAATKKFIGVNMTNVVNTGSVGDFELDLLTEGEINFPCASATTAWVGNLVFAVDDETVALAATTSADVGVGMVTQFVSATEVRVTLDINAAVGA